MSPIAALTGSAAATASRTAAITAGDGAPSEPSAGFLTSTMSAPAAAAVRASAASTTLTSSFMTARSERRGCRPSRAPRSPLPRPRPPSGSRARARRRRCRPRRRRPVPTSSGRRPRPRPRSSASTSAPARGWNRPPCTGANASPTSCWTRVSAPPNSSRSRSTSAGSSDVSTSCAIAAERSADGTSCANAWFSAGPDSPGSAFGTTRTIRHSSGTAWRISSGEGRSVPRRTPPSTTRPPSANVHIPTEERAARPAASASAGASTVRPCSAASACATASASFVPDPSPTCGGIASTMRRWPPPRAPARHGSAARTSARAPRRRPPRTARPPARASTHDRRAADRHPEPAEAARAVAGDREHAHVQARGRLDADRHASPTTART